MAKYSKKLTNAYKTLSKFIVEGAVGQPPEWPFPIIETNWYHSKFLVQELVKTFRDLRKEGLGNEEIGGLLKGPSAITHWLYIGEHNLPGVEDDTYPGLSREDRVNFFEQVVDLISSQRRNDKFCRGGRNLLLSSREVKKGVKELNFLDVTNETGFQEKLNQIKATLLQYCILIQIGHRAYSQEFHGPYEIGEEKQLFIRDYFNLRPKEVWNFSERFPWRSIRIYELYQGGEINVNMFNHFEVSDSACLENIAFEVNEEKLLDKDQIHSFSDEVGEILNKGNKTVKNFKKEQWVEKIIGMRYLYLKPMKKFLGKSWKPSREVYDLKNKINEAEEAGKKFQMKMGKLMEESSQEEAIKRLTDLFLKNIYE